MEMILSRYDQRYNHIRDDAQLINIGQSGIFLRRHEVVDKYQHITRSSFLKQVNEIVGFTRECGTCAAYNIITSHTKNAYIIFLTQGNMMLSVFYDGKNTPPFAEYIKPQDAIRPVIGKSRDQHDTFTEVSFRSNHPYLGKYLVGKKRIPVSINEFSKYVLAPSYIEQYNKAKKDAERQRRGRNE